MSAVTGPILGAARINVESMLTILYPADFTRRSASLRKPPSAAPFQRGGPTEESERAGIRGCECAKQGVRYGMQQNVAIEVASDTFVVSNLYSAGGSSAPRRIHARSQP